ncbi:YggS family pyridoxal phosphate-dependent enzyme [candidate division KSB1 bacterium]|nr:YggS family pyridoxal phosphate-dependent enzyme [candidate division KSB1 bacterium]
MDIKNNYYLIQQRIKETCARSGRNSGDVKTVVVTKTVQIPAIQEVIKAGATIIGENRIQDAWQKYEQIGSRVSWHLIGHLQTNKVKRAVQIFNVIESVDSLHLAEEINKRAKEAGKTIDIFVQVNTSGETSKFGLHPDDVESFITRLEALENIRITGLMTIGAFLPDPEKVRPCFRMLYNLRQELLDKKITKNLYHLSMGMTNDFEVAIEEGATLIRIGRAVFGERN